MAEARTLLKTMPSASVAILEALCLLWHDLWKWYNQLDEDTQRSHNIDWARWIANQNLPKHWFMGKSETNKSHKYGMNYNTNPVWGCLRGCLFRSIS